MSIYASSVGSSLLKRGGPEQNNLAPWYMGTTSGARAAIDAIDAIYIDIYHILIGPGTREGII